MANNPTRRQHQVMVGIDFKVNDITVSGAYSSSPQRIVGKVSDIPLKSLAPEGVADMMPDITIKSALCGYDFDQQALNLQATLGLDISLSDLPFIGGYIPAAVDFGLNEMSFALNQPLGKTEPNQQAKTASASMVVALVLGEHRVPLTLPLTPSLPSSERTTTPETTTPETTSKASKGTLLGKKRSMDGSKETFEHHTGDNSQNPLNQYQSNGLTPDAMANKSDGSLTTTSGSSSGSAEGMLKWFEVNKSIGPGLIKRIGVQYADEAVSFLFDMQMALGPLTLSLAGLSVGTSISQLDPTFNLSGLGLSYAKGPVALSGALLRDETTDAYQGVVMIKTPGLNIAALGAYQSLNGQPSVFIYGVMNFALGIGPPFLQISGLSAGFGYNRLMHVPDIEHVNEFPLVSAAMGTASGSTDPLDMLRKTQHYFPAQEGELFFAFGMKFSSFKMLESFALLTLRLGARVQLDLLGLSRLSVPPGISRPLAVVELALKAAYDFYEHSLKVQAELTSASYLFSRQCRLTGGFAFFSWFDGQYSGDFVFTMGGYHPSFKVPAHYPTVPRLGFDWQLTPDLSLTGGMYYALTPGAIMAGGQLKALFEKPFSVGFDIGIAGAHLSGKVRASFIIGADFLIGWLPYCYDAKVYLNVGISATFRGKVEFLFFSKSEELSFDLSLGANLRLWGPEFSGIAHIDWVVVSFDIKFGGAAKSKPQAISWSAFKSAFLPADDAICTLNVANGLINQHPAPEGELSVVDPAEFVLVTKAVIPSTQTNLTRLDANFDESIKHFGIASMGVSEVLRSNHKITITASDGQDMTSQFNYQPLWQSAPKGLWGDSLDTEMNAGLIEGLLTGFNITPKASHLPEFNETKRVADFAYDIGLRTQAYQWSTAPTLVKDSANEAGRRAVVKQIGGNTTRSQLLNKLGLDSNKVDLSALSMDTKNAFLVAPQVVYRDAA